MRLGLQGKEIKKLDKLWHQVICKRDNLCQYCNKQYSVEGHHIFLKGQHASVRFCLLNGIGVCRECHNWIHTNRKQSKIWIKQYLGKSHYELLKRKARKIKVYQECWVIEENLEGKL